LYKYEITVQNNKAEKNDKLGRLEITMIDKICLILSIIGSLNWGLVGLFRFDLVAWLFGGSDSIISRIIYTVIALAGIWCISLLFKNTDEIPTSHTRE